MISTLSKRKHNTVENQELALKVTQAKILLSVKEQVARKDPLQYALKNYLPEVDRKTVELEQLLNLAVAENNPVKRVTALTSMIDKCDALLQQSGLSQQEHCRIAITKFKAFSNLTHEVMESSMAEDTRGLFQAFRQYHRDQLRHATEVLCIVRKGNWYNRNIPGTLVQQIQNTGANLLKSLGKVATLRTVSSLTASYHDAIMRYEEDRLQPQIYPEIQEEFVNLMTANHPAAIAFQLNAYFSNFKFPSTDDGQRLAAKALLAARKERPVSHIITDLYQAMYELLLHENNTGIIAKSLMAEIKDWILDFCGSGGSRLSQVSGADFDKIISICKVPITDARKKRDLGLIEWVPDTKPLGDCILDQLPDQAPWHDADLEFREFVKTFKVGNDSNGGTDQGVDEVATNYHAMFMKCKNKLAIQMLNTLHQMLPESYLLKFFRKLSRSPHGFFALQQEFVESLAIANIFGYILGLGDRHLRNLLINLSTGHVVPIDFGYVFGSSSQVVLVPELVPFRHTHQIQQLAKPLCNNDSLESVMATTLSALQKKKWRILDMMEIYKQHPPMDFQLHASLVFKDYKRQLALQKYLHHTLTIMTAKLDGRNPGDLIAQELKVAHFNKPFLSGLVEAARGRPDSLRRTEGQVCRSTEYQVRCLLELASDPLSCTTSGRNCWKFSFSAARSWP
ncbi:hypothetical protein BGZ82_003407 [Podila clonocystis]|nr:hypothetical protein BGZ82_003407 [Podila clonocystis]